MALEIVNFFFFFWNDVQPHQDGAFRLTHQNFELANPGELLVGIDKEPKVIDQ